jgi:hypothetical protein
MSLWCFRENKHRELRHAGRGMAGIHQVRGMRPETSMSPGFQHAEMTELRNRNEINVASRRQSGNRKQAVL